MSQINCLTILLATSALAPLYFAPLLSCVVAQITSPSLLTSRTEALASLAVVTDDVDVSSAMRVPLTLALELPLMVPGTLPYRLPLEEPCTVPTAMLSEYECAS